jgi:hypothetical protein
VDVLVVAETTRFSEPVFKESIATIAASSSGTNGSSTLLSSDETRAIDLGGDELGDTTAPLLRDF